jgi:hypothetical protein
MRLIRPVNQGAPLDRGDQLKSPRSWKADRSPADGQIAPDNFDPDATGD